MKRNSILYDYKPRLEWSDPAAARKKNRRKKLLFGTSLLVLAGGLFVGLTQFSIDLPEFISFSIPESSNNSTQTTQTLELAPLTEEKPQIKVKMPSSVPIVEKKNLSSEPSTKITQNTESKTTSDDLPFEPEQKLVEQSGNNKDSQKKDEHTASKDLKEVLSSSQQWQTVTVKEGDNLSLIFSRLAISKNDLYQILSLGKDTQSLKRLKPGQVLRLKFEDSKVEELVHESDLTHTLKIKKTDNEFEAKIIEEKPEIKVATSIGSIQDSLFLSGQKAGLSDNVIMQMFDIFGWDIDFVLDIRKDDEFRVVYEELYKNGEKIKDGKILAAEFVNQGRVFKAVRYVDFEEQPGYYSEQGKSMRKAFLRTPVNFTRISSHFNLKRKHPVLNKIRAHKGVDYAAPLGTPVKSTGNGKVLFVGTKNGYGNTVIIQHGGKYTTLYAHLSRFSRGLKKGNRIEQGQTVAYVGKTGLATGPHLHYEFRVDGLHRNPLTVDLPKSLPLPEQYMKDFIEQTKPLLTQLASLSNESRHAKSEPTEKEKPEKIAIAAREYTLETTIN